MEGWIQEIGKDGAEHRQAQVGRGIRGHGHLEKFWNLDFPKQPFPAFLDH